MLFIAFTLFGGLAFLVMMGRLDEARTLREWELALTPEGKTVFTTVANQLRHERGMADQSDERAVEARDVESWDEAARFLRAGASVVESCSATLPELLRNLSVLSWQAAAIMPLPPLRPFDFRVAQLRTLAGIHNLLHHLLATSRERFRLRIAVLRYGLRAAVGLLLRNTHALVARPDARSTWDRVAAIRGDLGTLTDESLESLRVLLGSLAAVQVAAGRRPASQATRG
jgi:hypothetical protein